MNMTQLCVTHQLRASERLNSQESIRYLKIISAFHRLIVQSSDGWLYLCVPMLELSINGQAFRLDSVCQIDPECRPFVCWTVLDLSEVTVTGRCTILRWSFLGDGSTIRRLANGVGPEFPDLTLRRTHQTEKSAI